MNRLVRAVVVRNNHSRDTTDQGLGDLGEDALYITSRFVGQDKPLDAILSSKACDHIGPAQFARPWRRRTWAGAAGARPNWKQCPSELSGSVPNLRDRHDAEPASVFIDWIHAWEAGGALVASSVCELIAASLGGVRSSDDHRPAGRST